VAVAGILAAALSSIGSALNSLSAVLFEEILPQFPTARLPLARAVTVAWGVLAMGAGYAFSLSGETTIWLVNRVGSALRGPILGVFSLAFRSRRGDDRSALVGVAPGVAANLLVGWWAPSLPWLWWNPIGFGVAVAVGAIVGHGVLPRIAPPPLDPGSRTIVRALAGLFTAILATLVALRLAAG
jgi:solute:Na+ symporter, SSS family